MNFLHWAMAGVVMFVLLMLLASAFCALALALFDTMEKIERVERDLDMLREQLDSLQFGAPK